MQNELLEIADALDATANSPQLELAQPALDRLSSVVDEFDNAFSGSWLGYHSRVYYAGFRPPPPGARFSRQWGLEQNIGGMGTTGDWREFGFDDVIALVRKRAGDPDLEQVTQAAQSAGRQVEAARAEISSILSSELQERPDPYLERLKADLEKLKVLSKIEVARALGPSGRFETRDHIAVDGGIQVPPHMTLQAEVVAIRNAFTVCTKAGDIARRAGSHIARQAKRKRKADSVGTNVFLGHGRSAAWRELKDFIQDRLALPWDEFNRVPVAGVSNIARLAEMLDSAAVAFVIMTAEDQTADGETQARMNVIHEVGLFQGRLGFTKAIVLLEEGCAEFTNIQGLGQIRFPAGRISTAFEEVRQVLEREGLLGA